MASPETTLWRRLYRLLWPDFATQARLEIEAEEAQNDATATVAARDGRPARLLAVRLHQGPRSREGEEAVSTENTTRMDWWYMSIALVCGSLIVTAVALLVWQPMLTYAAGFCVGISITICGVEAVERGALKL